MEISPLRAEQFHCTDIATPSRISRAVSGNVRRKQRVQLQFALKRLVKNLRSCFSCLFPFLAYLPGVPTSIQLPDLKSQTVFNLARWSELLADSELAKLSYRLETDRLGRILMSPPPAFTHADRQGHIADFLKDLLPDGRTLPECPLSTADGVKSVDVVWLASARRELVERPVLLTTAPEICVEVLSPSNTQAEMDEKRALYFDAGASEVWVCNLDGSMSFFVGPDHQVSASTLCPGFPQAIP